MATKRKLKVSDALLERGLNRFNVPDVVKVGWMDYAVTPITARDASEKGIAGQIRYDLRRIEYCEDLNPGDVVNVIIHELLHGIFHMFSMSSDHEEYVVNTIANGLTTIFRDNPQLVCWIAQTLEEK